MYSKRCYFLQIDVWTEMAKEMKTNFGARSKSINSKPGGGGSLNGSAANSGNWPLPPPNAAGFIGPRDLVAAHPINTPNNDSNNSSVQSNSNSEFSEIIPEQPPGPPPCQAPILKQKQTTPSQSRGGFPLNMDEDPYGPMSGPISGGQFYTGSRNNYKITSQSVLTSPERPPSCAYHSKQNSGILLSGSSADLRHYQVKIMNRTFQSGTNLNGHG